jgi:hypothetical protein
MSFLTRLFESELFMSVALAVVPWAVARAFAWWRAEAARREDERYPRAVQALEVGVHEAWERYGRAWKHARADGKLTDDERARLRSCAVEAAAEVGREEGLELAKVLGRRAVNALVRKIVERRKAGA